MFTGEAFETNEKEPTYVLRTVEAVLMPTDNDKKELLLRNGVWVLVGIIILGSIIFHENLFSELSWTARIIFIVLVVKFGFYGTKLDYAPSPMELHLYEDKLILFLPKRYCSRRVSRKEISEMKYSEITKCVYKTKLNTIQIFGDGKSKWYNYKKDGTLPQTPTEDRTFTQGMIYFDVRFAREAGVDVVKEIEEHSPLRVSEEDD